MLKSISRIPNALVRNNTTQYQVNRSEITTVCSISSRHETVDTFRYMMQRDVLVSVKKEARIPDISLYMRKRIRITQSGKPAKKCSTMPPDAKMFASSIIASWVHHLTSFFISVVLLNLNNNNNGPIACAIPVTPIIKFPTS